ncbi:peptidylprolyl isomerase [Mycobacterium sp. CVI_P3]|uniref:Peptidylprolyl isomerase n=1 Tax=Mycobacterium pinniadriaticum TaxID=2994102 RepID=A0ABT3SNF1_9MYCO|nr:peptidylprolyl isomerase [Mycobacterium pinniadriaticum]MCX2934628.1 peptidylprolyl isomerase [Mycobacterium pinniadriaticum]MCX2941051.1 peptidylprolyl isomerase [Mycobacterium pinniadriaticum]
MSQPPPHYPPPPYYGSPYGPGPYPYPAPPPTNGMAIASLICAFVFAPLGIVFGHISLSQIKKSGEEGRGLAIAGLVISYLVTVLSIMVLVVGVVFFSWMARELERTGGGAGIPRAQSPGPGGDELPPFNPPAALGANCTYPATATPADKPNKPPRTGKVPTVPATVDATVTTNAGVIGLQLDNAKAPCTVNSFVSLAQQGYFDNTGCHRLTDTRSMSVLQCGDPTGSGSGGPGYRFANEYPTNQYRPFDTALKRAVRYPRGTLAMANAGPDTNGSQFFIVYRDSMLPPTYTVFGRVDETGLATVEDIAAAGIAGGGSDGKPKRPATIKSIRLD